MNEIFTWATSFKLLFIFGRRRPFGLRLFSNTIRLNTIDAIFVADCNKVRLSDFNESNFNWTSIKQ